MANDAKIQATSVNIFAYIVVILEKYGGFILVAIKIIEANRIAIELAVDSLFI